MKYTRVYTPEFFKYIWKSIYFQMYFFQDIQFKYIWTLICIQM